jgi:hypothetical protein
VDLLASFHTCVDRSEAAFLCIGSIRVSTIGRHVSISDACGGQASRGSQLVALEGEDGLCLRGPRAMGYSCCSLLPFLSLLPSW